MNRTYFDNAASTQIDPAVQKSMHEFEGQFFGNPNSLHREGQAARAAIDNAREVIAKFIQAEPQEIIFTSGATESNNLAIQGVINHALYSKKITKPHIITTELEHQCVYNTIKSLTSRGLIESTFIKPDKHGQINANQVLKAIRDNTILVSAIFVSNEIGSILPIREIGKILFEINLKRKQKIVFHTDAAQALKYLNCNVKKSNLDLLTGSAHKIYGPKGIGILYIKQGTPLDNLMFGGAQEYAFRPGTQNTVGIIGMAVAIKLLGSLEKRQETAEKIKKLSDKLIKFFQTEKYFDLNGPIEENRAPDIISATIYGIDQDLLVSAVDLAGFAVSTGSACVSGSSKPSHVIESLGKIGKKKAATIRISLSKNNTEEEIDKFIDELKRIVLALR